MKKEEFENYTLYCGDVLEIIPELSGIDAILTDPPYSSGGFTRGDRMQSTRTKYQTSNIVGKAHANFTGDNRDQRSWIYWMSLWLGAALRASNSGALVGLFTDWRQLPSLTDAMQCAGAVWRGIVVWDKVNARPLPNSFRAQCEYFLWGSNGPRNADLEGATYHKGVIQCNAPPTSEREHSTQKPVKVMEHMVAACPAGGTVLDPFMGSGTTGVACANLGRKFIGIELVPEYFDISRRRIEQAYAQGQLFTPEKETPQGEFELDN